MMDEDKKKFSELVLAERKKGNVVFLALDEILSMPVKDIVKQPVEGLLWDLNRDEVTALTFMDREGMNHWVNNFAVALVIKELKKQLDDVVNAHGALKRENALLCTYAMKLEGRASNSSVVVDIRHRLGLSETMMTWIIPDEHRALLAQEPK